MTSNPSPDSTPDLATPRPWVAPTMPTDIPIPPVVRVIDQDESGRRRTRFVAEFLECADGSLDPHANAILAVEAVNNYDRLKAIEAAARAMSDAFGVFAVSGMYGDGSWAVLNNADDALRAAIQGGSKP